APLLFRGVGVGVIRNVAFGVEPKLVAEFGRRRLTVFMIGRAGAGGPKLMSPAVEPVKAPYERQSFRENAKGFCVLFVKQTLPASGFKSGGMMKSGAGAPGRFANSCVASNTGELPMEHTFEAVFL